MRIVINAVSWSHLIKGTDRYCLELIYALAKIDTANQYYIFYGKWQENFKGYINNKNLQLIKINWFSNRILRNIWHAFIFPFLARKFHPDIVHLPGTMPLIFKNTIHICSIHDELLEFSFPEKYGWFRSLARKIIVKLETKKSDHIIAVSPNVKKALLTRLGINSKKISLVLNGVNLNQFNPSYKKHSFNNITKPYILFVSVIDKNKNLETLIQAYNQLSGEIKNRYIIVVAGKKGNAYITVKKYIQKFNLSKQVLFLGHVTENLADLYANASVFVMPSLYEGFSLPVLEAMASKIPVIISNSIAVAPFVKNGVITFNPNNTTELKSALERILLNPQYAHQIAQKGFEISKNFSWEKTALATLEVYKKVNQRVP